jgi:hypothetical protein
MAALFHECDEECADYTDKDHPIKKRWQIGDDYYNRCPHSTVPRETWYWLKAYQFFKQGILPTSGGWLDQTNKFNEIMLFIDGQILKHKKEQNGRQ